MTDKPPKPIIQKMAHGYMPATAFDEECLDGFPQGTQFELTPTSKRTHRHLGTYWGALGRVVKATGKWPTSAHLHDELKYACGYRREIIDWETGEVHTVLDSIAFDAMTHAEFKEYFDKAMETLAENVGFDPLGWMNAP